MAVGGAGFFLVDDIGKKRELLVKDPGVCMQFFVVHPRCILVLDICLKSAKTTLNLNLTPTALRPIEGDATDTEHTILSKSMELWDPPIHAHTQFAQVFLRRPITPEKKGSMYDNKCFALKMNELFP